MPTLFRSALSRAVLVLALLMLGAIPRTAAAQIPPEVAAQIVVDSLITGSPRADSLVAFFYQFGTNPSLPPGYVISDLDSTFEFETFYPETYFFWLDNEPSADWAHDCSYVFMDAFDGSYTVVDARTWPVINGNEYDQFTFLGNDSPERFYGTYATSNAVFAYSAVTTPNTQDWAIVVVGRNSDGDREKKARKNDLDRIKDYLNGSPLGPKVNGGNIIVKTGADTLGATVAELCAAIDSIKNAGACDKVYFYYIGHGGNGRMILKKPNGRSDKYKYKNLACKLLELSPKEYCIVIEACHSGSAIRPIKKKKVNKNGKEVVITGGIVTSSSPGKTTKRAPDGTPFHKGMQSCGRDPLADFDGDGKVGLFEAIAWARNQDASVAGDSPRAEGLGDERKVKFLAPSVGRNYYNNSTGSRLCYNVVKYRYKLRKGSSTGRDTTICVTNIYVRNPSTTQPHRPTQKAKIVCKRRGKPDTTVANFWPRLAKGERRCIARMPEDCKRITVVGGGTNLAFGAQVADVGINEDLRVTAYNPGDLLLHTAVIDIGPGSSYSQSLATSSLWPTNLHPLTFGDNGIVTEQTAFFNADVDVLATEGDVFTWEIDRLDQPDTLTITVEALVIQAEAGVINTSKAYTHTAVRALSGVDLALGSLDLSQSVIQLSGGTPFTIGSGAFLGLDHSTVQSDSVTDYNTLIQGSIGWDHGVFVAPENGLVLDGVSGGIYGGGVFASNGDGLILQGGMASLTVNFYEILESSGNGLRLDGATGVTLNNVVIENSTLSDVIAMNASDGQLIDCAFDGSKVTTDLTSSLTRSWTTHLLLHDDLDQPTVGASVEVRDAFGTLYASALTDSNGAVEYMVLDEWVQAGAVRTLHTPYQITMTMGGDSLTMSHDAVMSDFIDVQFPPAPTGVDPETPSIASGGLTVYPNPFNPRTAVAFTLERPGLVTLTVYNVMGARVRRLAGGALGAGPHAFEWDGRDDRGNRVASGVYHVQLIAGDKLQTTKAVLIQ